MAKSRTAASRTKATRPKRKPVDCIKIEWLLDAWERVRQGANTPGVDGIDLATFEAGETAYLDELLADMASRRYRPQAYRGIDIPKSGGGARRIVVATVRDRVAQHVALGRLQPILEPLFHPASYAYRRGLGVQDALLKVCEYRDRGYVKVLLADIERFFDTVSHTRLFDTLASAGVGADWLEWIRAWLKAPVLDAKGSSPQEAGLPQGLPVSPLLANFYLTPFDRSMADAGLRHVRYADDVIVCCMSAEEQARAESVAAAALGALNLQLSQEKTRRAAFDTGFEYLGARFVDSTLIPAAPHPYEQEFSGFWSKKPRRPPLQALPYSLLRTLYLQDQGSRLGVHGVRLVVSKGENTLLDLPAHQVDQIFIFGRVQISTYAMTFCLMRHIPLYLFSSRGRYYGALRHIEDSGYELRKAQFDAIAHPSHRLEIARAVVVGKITNALNLLAQHARNHPETDLHRQTAKLKGLLKRLPHAKNIEALRGMEGSAAAAYFEGFAKCLRGPFEFTNRVRRPPTDPVNSMLSFGYTLLFYNIHSYVCARGLDPAAGFFHEPGRNHPALVSDLIEEFRAPVVDALVLSLANRNQLSPADFYFAEGRPQPCMLRDESRPVFLQAFEQKLAGLLHHPDVSLEVNWRRVLDLQVCRLRRHIEGKIDRYEPFITGED